MVSGSTARPRPGAPWSVSISTACVSSSSTTTRICDAYCARLLHGFGAREVYEAEDGAAGLEAFTHYLPDIVITDWAMPIFDGLELVQMIRQPGANANPYVAIIMLTGHSEKKRVTAARDAGVTEFLAKPISAKGLYQRIINVVANPRPFIKTKTYFGPDRRRITNSNYIGPERRKGGKADVIRQTPLLEKASAGLIKALPMSHAKDTQRSSPTAITRLLCRKTNCVGLCRTTHPMPAGGSGGARRKGIGRAFS